MIYKYKLIYFLIITLLFSCSKKVDDTSVLKETSLEAQMIEVYNQGMEEFKKGDVIYAGKKFGEAELLYPQSIWAPRAVLMSAYGHFSQGYFNYAINDLNRFLVKYSYHTNTDYAYYLLALCHYNLIVDEKKDFNEIKLAKKYFQYIIKNYPNTEYAIDSKFKLELIIEISASKEMYLAKYYTQREKWIPAINRYKNVINKYQTTIYVEEALHRLVEIHYIIGLEDEAKKYAVLLGYNYKSSEWYEESYKVFNRDYEKISIRKKNKNKKTVLEKLRSLIQ